MAHCNKKQDKRTLRQQAYDRLKKMESYGDNKYEDKRYDREHETDITSTKIYSHNTFLTYKKQINYFLHWVRATHPEIKKLDKAKKYVPEWLQTRVESNLSAWTIQTEAAALNKLFGIKKDDPNRFQPPERKKEDIKRSRGHKQRDAHFSEKKNEELVNFCKGCGFRRNILEKLKGSDLYDREKIEIALEKAETCGDKAMIKACKDALYTFTNNDLFILHRKDKGGKTRIAPIVGPNVDKIVKRMKDTTPNKKVWDSVPECCDVHGYRADYAAFIYKAYAKSIKYLRYDRKIKCADGKYRSEIYVCRGSEYGKKLDRRALHIVSIALGHNREDTVIANYLRDIF